MSGMRPGRDRDAALFSSISRQFVGTACRQCSGSFLATLGMQADFQPNEGSTAMSGTQPDFQAFQGSFWVMVCRPCPGRVRAMARMEPDFQAF
ncbi:Hypothetical predicted protein [Olea europaea subsp. europaea]|uniref:Uncharacterized protein n=1 Tax=Olea europaea subsp. europaea TaxID=158383 RepID=A0A8S0URN5_OLEEU|nr:Hypothetical predicted protein [Olea europaea subsp. europaea]